MPTQNGGLLDGSCDFDQTALTSRLHRRQQRVAHLALGLQGFLGYDQKLTDRDCNRTVRSGCSWRLVLGSRQSNHSSSDEGLTSSHTRSKIRENHWPCLSTLPSCQCASAAVWCRLIPEFSPVLGKDLTSVGLCRVGSEVPWNTSPCNPLITQSIFQESGGLSLWQWNHDLKGSTIVN